MKTKWSQVKDGLTANAPAAQIPREALTFGAAELRFGDNGENAKTAPVTIVARSGKPIEHWFWGTVVHDLSGMKLAKPKVPIDYVHDDYEILGYLNKFDTASGDLVCSGAIVPYADKDRAAEVLHKQQEGVPYEASLNFDGDGIKVQELAKGEVADVNGYKLEGPAVIIREWPLRGVAICPYGADANTSTKFKNDQSETRSITLFTKERAMSQGNPAEVQTPATVDADKKQDEQVLEVPPEGATVEGTPPQQPAEGAKPSVDAAAAEKKASQAKVDPKAEPYIKAFGDKGARWYLEGKPFPDATAEFVASLKEEHKKEVDALTTKLSASKLGNDPVQFQAATEPGDKNKPQNPANDPNKLSAKLGDNLAKVAAGIKLPGKADAQE
jgi:hypothetical protein